MIVIELTSTQLSVAHVQGHGASARVTASFVDNWPMDVVPENAERLGEWLKDRLAKERITGSSSIVLLGKGVVNLKAIRVPVVPDNELASVVSFAAAEALPQAGEGVVDYQPGMLFEASPGHPGDEQEVMAAAISAPYLDAIRRSLVKAGAPAKRISLRAYGTRAGWESVVGTLSQHASIVHVVDGGLEISLWNGDSLRACRTVALPSNQSSRIANELVRTLAAFSTGTESGSLQEVALIAPPDSDTVLGLEHVVECPIHVWPTTGPPPNAAAWVGGSRMDTKIGPPIDFLKPKRSAPATNGKRSAMILSGILAAVILLGVFWMFSRQIGQRDARIAAMTAELNHFSQEIAGLKPTTDRHRVMKDWLNNADPILEELQEIAGALPDTSDLFLTGLEYNASQGGQPGTIKLDGVSRDQSIITRAQTRLAGDSDHRYQVVPRGIEPGADFGPFVWRFGLDLVVEPLESAQYQAQSEKRLSRLEELDKIPPQMERRNLSLARTLAAGSPGQGGKERPSKKEEKKEGTTTAAGGAGGGGFLEKKIEEIKKLPPQEREAAIAKEPKFFQKRLRQALEKGAP